jgi:TetR/AcrR family transcriptional regulator, transcriptional repressor for nem operon
MGRNKSYDREELVEKAMGLFRDHGYAGTSAEMLAKGLGVNRYSIYAEFGSKQGLFDAALQRYDEVAVERNFGPLEAPAAGVDEVCALLEFFGSANDSPALGRGCLLCNTAVEFGPNDPGGGGFIQRYFKRLSDAFFTALNNARIKGELLPTIDVRGEADFFTASVLGMFVMLRAKAPATSVKGAAQAAKRHLEELRT